MGRCGNIAFPTEAKCVFWRLNSTCDGMTSDEIVSEVGVDPRSCDRRETKRLWCIRGCFFVDVTMRCGIPIISLRLEMGMVRALRAVSKGSMFELGEKSNNASCSTKVTFAWVGTET